LRKILIIQNDGPVFLHSALRVLRKYFSDLPDTEITVLAAAESFQALGDEFEHLKMHVKFTPQEILSDAFDIGVNLSLQESSWKLLEDTLAQKRLGIYLKNGQVRVSDHWSTYLLTLKSPVPFVNFHLEEIYKNILGAKQAPQFSEDKFLLQKFIFAISPATIFPPGEQEAFLNLLTKRFPGVPVLDISEARPGETEGVFYIGPAEAEVVTINYPRNLLVQKKFQGANLLPTESTWILTNEKTISGQDVLSAMESILNPPSELPGNISLYQTRYCEEEDSFIKKISGNELTYPIYLAYFVLWSFVLGLKEAEPDLPKVDSAQKELIRTYLEIIKKISRFHTYALASLDILLTEAKAEKANSELIEGHLENLRQIDETLRNISDAHALLRPLLDFYHIRRGQTEGDQFREQVENSLLIYHEEHQAFSAFQELLEALERR
jgi:hypothetical protein